MPDSSDILVELLEQEGGRLLSLLKRLTLREDIAADLLQDLAVRLLESRTFVQARSKAAFARRSAINLAFNWRRSRKRQMAPLEAEVPGPAASPQKQAADAEQFQAILEAGETLSDLHREVFILHYVEQEPYEAIADQLGKTPQQVRGLAHRAVEEIRSRLNPRRSQTQSQG